MEDPTQIQEYISRSWYDYTTDEHQGLHPYDGETKLNYTGPKPPFELLDVEQSYSWLKSPRTLASPVIVAHTGHVADPTLHSLLYSEHIIVLAVTATIAFAAYTLHHK